MNTRFLALPIAAACMVLILMPFKLTLHPARMIKVVDSKGTAIDGAIVRQVWYQYSLGVKGEEDFRTDPGGFVNLPKRAVGTNIAKLCLGALKNFRKYFVNAGYGSRESIGIFAEGYSDKWFHDSKNRQIGVVVLEQ
jgi:hypothetical protein